MKRVSSIVRALCLAALCAMPFASQANVATYKMADNVTTILYPVVQIQNMRAQQIINNDLKQYFVVSPQNLAANDVVEKQLFFTVKYEDNQWLSLVIHDYTYTRGAAHGMRIDKGLVYNKMTGERVPLSYFVNIKDMNQIYLGILTQSINFGSIMGKPLPYSYDFKLPTQQVPDNYFLAGNASVGIIFQPYEMGPYSYGTTVATLPPDYVKGLNIYNAK